MNLGAYRPKTPLPELIPQAAPGAAPGAFTPTPGVLDSVPILYPGGPTDVGFLYAQLQKMPLLGAANTWTGAQTLNCPNNTNALILTSSGTAPNNRHVKTTWAGTWEVGTNLLNDGVDVDFYWTDLSIGLFRMRLDTDGQLSLPGWASLSGVSFNYAVNNTLNMAARPLDGSAPVNGFGVGILLRLPDSTGLVQTVGALNCVINDVTPATFSTRLDINQMKNGLVSTVFSCGGSGSAIWSIDTATSAISTVLTLVHTTGASSAGCGAQIVFQGKDSAVADVILARTAALMTTTTSGSVDSAWAVVPKYGGTNVEVLRVRGGAGMAATADATAVQGNVGGQAWVRGDLLVTGTGGATIALTDAGTTNEPTLTTWQHRTSGTPGVGFGSIVAMQADNTSHALTDQLAIAAGWSSATAGAENSLVIFSIRRAGVDTEVLRLNSVGNGRAQFANDLFHANAGGAIGFYGVGPVTRPTVSGSRGSNAALASLLSALASQGIITDSSS